LDQSRQIVAPNRHRPFQRIEGDGQVVRLGLKAAEIIPPACVLGRELRRALIVGAGRYPPLVYVVEHAQPAAGLGAVGIGATGFLRRGDLLTDHRLETRQVDLRQLG
jgi:hypothetical protein